MAIVKMNRFTLLAFESHKPDLLKALQTTRLVHFKNTAAWQEDMALSAADGEAVAAAPDISARDVASAVPYKTASDEQTDEEVMEAEFSLDALDRLSYNEELSFAENELAKVSFAMSKLEPYRAKKAPPPPDLSFSDFDGFISNYDYQAAYELIKEQDEKLKSLKTERAKLKTDNEALSAWTRLDCSTKDLEGTQSVVCQLGTLSRQTAQAFQEALSSQFPCSYVELYDPVREDVTALLIMSQDEAEGASSLAKAHGFTRINLSLEYTPREIIAANDKRAAAIEKEEAACVKALCELVGHYNDLAVTYDYFKTLAERHRVCENFLKTKDTFLSEGWFAKDDASVFEDVVKDICGDAYYLEVEEVEKDSEEVPIRLKNNAFVASFEGVTEMYSMPKYNEIDPTPLLTPFYILFFAAMFGDAGYGLVLAVAAGIVLCTVKLKEGSKRFFKFFLYLGVATVGMGIIYGSLFGIAFFMPMTNAAGEPAPILDLTGDIMTMFILSIAVGVVHVFAGLFIKGYLLIRDGKPFAALFDAGFWILAVGSLIGWLVTMMLPDYAHLTPICQYIFIGSVVGLVATQGRESKSIGGKIGSGLYSVYSITGFIGDFVSYSRVMALALASAYIAFSFNLMASLVAGVDSFAEIAEMGNYFLLVPAALIAVFGAALNMGLGALGSYVHSCRLQYVEYFGKFYEGGGVPFMPFEIKSTYTTISNSKGGNKS